MDFVCPSTRTLWPIILLCLDFVSGAKDRVPYRGGSRWEVSRISQQRKGYRMTSSYIKYKPGVRYTREYTPAYGFPFEWYYSTYFYHSGTEKYLKRRHPSENALVCVSLEANENGTVMGVFTCPNSWEPLDYTYCCGYTYTEFCCPEWRKYNTATIIGISAGALVGVGSLAIIIYICVVCARLLSSDSSSNTTSGVSSQVRTHRRLPPTVVSASSTNGQPDLLDRPVSEGPDEDCPPCEMHVVAKAQPANTVNARRASEVPGSSGPDEDSREDSPPMTNSDPPPAYNDVLNSSGPCRDICSSERRINHCTPLMDQSTSV